MKQHVRLVVLEHLRDEFHVHILDVDLLVLAVISLRHEGRKKVAYLEASVHHHD